MQSSSQALSLSIEVSIVFNEDLSYVQVTFIGCNVQSSPVLLVVTVDISSELAVFGFVKCVLH